MKKLFRWIKPYPWLILSMLILAILVPVTYSFVPQFIRYVIRVLGGSENEIGKGAIALPSFLLSFFETFKDVLMQILIVGITLVLFQLVRGILMFLNDYAKGKMAENIARDMRVQTYSHIQNLSYSYHNNADTGDLIQRCTSDVDTVKSFLSSQLPQILYIIMAFSSSAVQMGMINLRIMLITLIIVPFSLISSIIYFRYVKKLFEEVEEVEASMTTVLQENVNGVRVVKAFAKEKYEIDKFDRENKKYRDKVKKLNKAMGLYWGISDFATMLQYTLTVGVSIYFAKTGIIDAGDIIACLMYIGSLVYPIRGLGRIIGDFGKATVAAGRITEVLDVPDEYINDGNLKPEIIGNIEFKNVTFKFDNTDKHILDGINFKINSGETVAIIGKTGSGKSTIANLLVKMLINDDGEILLNGVNIKEISKKWVRENVGIILQDPFLYATTIYNNISIAKKDISKEEVYNAAKIAAIDTDIANFEQKYDTLVGEKGVTLSGGQKQRMSIARMLVLNKPIMIFDDSLSAVDTSTDLAIRNALKNQNKNLTSIIITHRITTAKEADKIIVLENGKVSAIGNHLTLSKKIGLYKSLWDIQGELEHEFLEIAKGVDKDE